MIHADTSRVRRQAEVNGASGPIRRVWALMSQLCCRHSYILRAGDGRLRLECTECGYTTPGIAANRACRASTVTGKDGTVNSPLGRFH
jgi:hypothetical protein